MYIFIYLNAYLNAAHLPTHKRNKQQHVFHIECLDLASWMKRSLPCNLNATCFLTLAIQMIWCPVSIGVLHLEHPRTPGNTTVTSKKTSAAVRRDFPCPPSKTSYNVIQEHTISVTLTNLIWKIKKESIIYYMNVFMQHDQHNDSPS